MILTYNQGTSGSPAISETVVKLSVDLDSLLSALLQSNANIRNKQVSFNNGVLYCTFQRAIAPVQNEQNKVFDLNAVCFAGIFGATRLHVQDYYLLLAYGNADGPRTLTIHDLGAARPIVTPSTENVAVSIASVGELCTGCSQLMLVDL